MSEPKPINNKLLWGLLITIIVSGGLLNGGRFASSNIIDTIFELLLLASTLTLMYLVWRRTTVNAGTRAKKFIQLLRILLTVTLVISLVLMIGNNLKQYGWLTLGLIISSLVSALGLIILTLIYNSLTSKERFNKPDNDS